MIRWRTDKALVVSCYVLSLLVFVNFTSSFIFWFWLEFNMIIFISTIVFQKSQNDETDIFSQCLYYFVIQSTTSVLLLVLFSNEAFILKDILILSLISIKMGIVPFQFWSYKISNYLSSFNIFIILNLQKIPLIIFLVNYNLNIILPILLVNIVVGALFLSSRNNFLDVIVRSRICFFNWLIFIILWTAWGFVLFFVKYLLFNVILLQIKDFTGFSRKNLFFNFKLLFLLVFILGLPPFIYFFYKFYIISITIKVGGVSLFTFLWLFSFLCLVSYFNFLIPFLGRYSNIYKTANIVKPIEILIFFSIILSIIMFS